MLIQPDPELRKQAIEALRTEYRMDQGRPGLHQSQLSYCLTKTYRDMTEPEPITETEVKLFAIGFGLERVLLAREPTPEVVSIDGIEMSLDSTILFGGGVDLKSTRMRAAGRKGEEGFQWPSGWRKQMMSYRYAQNWIARNTCSRCLRSHWQHRGELSNCRGFQPQPEGFTFSVIVVHLVEPEVTAWTAVFTREELNDHWAWLLTRRDWLESMLNSHDAMPFKFVDEGNSSDWQCKGCRYRMACELEVSLDQLEGENG